MTIILAFIVLCWLAYKHYDLFSYLSKYMIIIKSHWQYRVPPFSLPLHPPLSHIPPRCINRLSIIRKSANIIKQDFFQAVILSVLLNRCTTCIYTNMHAVAVSKVGLYGCIIYIYIYIYILILRQTVSLYHNSSVWLDTQDAASRDWNPPNFTLDFVSYRSAISRHTSA